MNIELSKNKFWLKYCLKVDEQKVDQKLDDAWHRWEPSFTDSPIEKSELERIKSWRNDLKAQKIDYLIIIGMGGSALGAKAIEKYGFKDHSKLLFWEGSHPSLLKKYSKILENQKAALLWISKSGTTLESRVNLATVREFFDECPEYFITSFPEKIADICNNPAKIFNIPKKLGGRFSIISPVGLMPATFLGANVESFLDGFFRADEEYHVSIPIKENQAKKIAYEIFSILKNDFYGVTFWVYSKELLGWGDWIVQLWGESIGKDSHIEVLPSLMKGPEDQHSLLQFFQDGPNKYVHIFCHTKSYAPYNARISDVSSGSSVNHTLWEILQAQMKGTEYALSEVRRPIAEYIFPQIYQNTANGIEPDMESMGKWMGYWMYVVTYVAYLYDVDPFNQPGVEKGKKYCTEVLNDRLADNIFSDSVEI